MFGTKLNTNMPAKTTQVTTYEPGECFLVRFNTLQLFDKAH